MQARSHISLCPSTSCPVSPVPSSSRPHHTYVLSNVTHWSETGASVGILGDASERAQLGQSLARSTPWPPKACSTAVCTQAASCRTLWASCRFLCDAEISDRCGIGSPETKPVCRTLRAGLPPFRWQLLGQPSRPASRSQVQTLQDLCWWHLAQQSSALQT